MNTRLQTILALCWLSLAICPMSLADELSDEQMQAVVQLEQDRIEAINQVIGSVIAIYGNDRSGGGSGVIIHPSGIALTNHHVIMGAGVEGWGGIADGKLYKWKLIGTDPGGDVSMIQLEGRDDFPCTPLGDSDKVRVGDWALAMGNPFILTEDQSPTVTLGIVSGVKRYQPGAGQNQLEYGNCIQVDSSINPGNSGGPLFNFQGEVIGINGRGSFQDRGRVNVGLGYAISSNQIRNFIPELLATKLVEHATLDANFANRGGKVVCSQLNRDAPVAKAGLNLGDELLEFEGVKIRTANEFTNLICTIPELWPVSLKVRDADGKEKSLCVRAFGLPYSKPRKPRRPKPNKDKTPEEKSREKQRDAMIELLSAPPGEIRHPEINQKYAQLIIEEWKQRHLSEEPAKGAWTITSIETRVAEDGKQEPHRETLVIFDDGRFLLDSKEAFAFDGANFYVLQDGDFLQQSLVEAKTNPRLMGAWGIAAPLLKQGFAPLGTPLIDGSDRTGNSVAWRLRIDDPDQDSTFAWIEINQQGGDHATARMLRKIAAYRDCNEQGGVRFADFQFHRGLAIPQKRTLVHGLDEAASLSIDVESVEWSDSVDDSVFANLAPGKETAPQDLPEANEAEESQQ